MKDSGFIKLGIAFLILIFLAILLTLSILFSNRIMSDPFKYAVKYEEIDNREHIICKRVMITGFNWRTENGELINVIGKHPYKNIKNSDIEFSDNRYILYGYYIDDIYEFDGCSYRTFNCTDWDIIYPIKRNLGLFSFIYSKEYISESECTFK